VMIHSAHQSTPERQVERNRGFAAARYASGSGRLLVLAALLIGPSAIGLSSYNRYLASLTLLYVLAAGGLNLMLGYAGIISLAQGSFFGLGSYVIAILQVHYHWSFWLACAASLAIGAVVALVAAVALLRLKMHTSALFTLALNVVFALAATHLAIGGETLGLPGIKRPGLFGVTLRSDRAYGLFIGVVVFLGMLVVAKMTSGNWGRAFMAIRENEPRADAVGVNVTKYKMLAFLFGSLAAVIAGDLYAPLVGYIDPTSFPATLSISFLIMVILGGRGRFAGAIIGATVVTILPQLLQATASVYLFLFGIVVVLATLFAPDGIAGMQNVARRWFRAARRSPTKSSAPVEDAVKRADQGGPAVQSRPAMRTTEPSQLAQSQPRLQTSGLSIAFGGLAALDDVDINVRAGEILGLLGPNGSGKSTWINCVTGIAKPRAGRVLHNGTDLTGGAPHIVWRRGVARTFQRLENFRHLTVYDNLLIALQESHGSTWSRLLRDRQDRWRDEIEGVLALVGLTDLRDAPIGSLSYGQQKLCDLAMALVGASDLIFLDEPMAGVNPTLIQRLVETIRVANRAGRTFVIVEHNMKVIMGLCSRIVVLENGKVIADGPPSEIQSDERVLEAYFGVDYDGVELGKG